MTEPESRSEARNTALVAAGIMLSRFAGLIRAALVLPFLNATPIGDAFVTAMRIPNMMQNLLGEGALSASFIPEYTRLRKEDERAAGALAGAIFSLLLMISGVFALIGIVAARPLTRAIAWGFTGETFEWAVKFVRIFSVGAGFLVLSAWCLGVLNSHRRFFLSYVAPVVWNATQIIVLALVVWAGWGRGDQATAIAWSVVIGGVLQFAIQVPAVRRADREIAIRRPLRTEATRRVIRRLGPAIVGRGAMQISAFADLALASLLAAGAPLMIAASQPLYILPLSMIALSAASAALPTMSTLTGPEATEHARDTTRNVGFLMSLVLVAYLTLGDRVVWAVFSLGGLRNGFDDDTILVIATILAAFALGLPAMGASRQLQNILFSQGDTSTPSRISIVRISVAFALGITLMFQLDRLLVFEGDIVGWTSRFDPLRPLPASIRSNGDLPVRFGALGLALASSCGALVEFFLLRRAVRQRYGTTSDSDAFRKVVLAGTAAAAVTVGLRFVIPTGPRLVETLALAAVLIGVYMGTATRLGHPTARSTVDGIRRRIGRE